MDSQTPKRNVDAEVLRIKQHMPQTYKAIQAKATSIGNDAYALVKRGLRGEPNCFFAAENGLVMGTPFTKLQGTAWLADLITKFGSTYVCTFPLNQQELDHANTPDPARR